MTAENKSTEMLVLGSRVNRICDINSRKEINVSLLLDAQEVINAFAPRLKTTGNFIEGSYSKPQNPFGGMMSTNTGDFQMPVNRGGERNEIHIGEINKDRIGLYRVTKSSEGKNFALNFNYFMEQVSTNEEVVGVGPITHILYNKKDNLLSSLVKSSPVIHRIGHYNLILYKQSNLWGKDKLENTLNFRIIR